MNHPTTTAVLCVKLKTVRRKAKRSISQSLKTFLNRGSKLTKNVKSALIAKFMLKVLHKVRLNKMLMMDLHALRILSCRLEKNRITNACFVMSKKSLYQYQKRQKRCFYSNFVPYISPMHMLSCLGSI